MPDIHVVIFQRDKWWVAQCLQYDIGAQAMSAPEVVYQLQRSLVGHVVICNKEGVEPFSMLPKAPDEYWEMWKGAKITLEYPEEPFRTADPVSTGFPQLRNMRLAA